MSDDEWALVAPHLALLPENAGQREHPRREVLNALRHVVRNGIPWRAVPNDLPPSRAMACAAPQADRSPAATDGP